MTRHHASSLGRAAFSPRACRFSTSSSLVAPRPRVQGVLLILYWPSTAENTPARGLDFCAPVHLHHRPAAWLAASSAALLQQRVSRQPARVQHRRNMENLVLDDVVVAFIAHRSFCVFATTRRAAEWGFCDPPRRPRRQHVVTDLARVSSGRR